MLSQPSMRRVVQSRGHDLQRLVWSAMPDGTVIVRAKNRSILDMAAARTR